MHRRIVDREESVSFMWLWNAQIDLQISVVDIIKPASLEAFKEVYLIQELMET